MKIFKKLFTDIQESYNELVYKVSWPTRAQLVSSSILVMIASIVIAAVIWVIDMAFSNVMDFVYGL